MKVFSSQGGFDPALRNSVVAIGNFDGVHRGHQQLLAVASEKAAAIDRPWGIITFEPHPRSVFNPSMPIFRITPRDLKLRLFAAFGPAFADVIRFDMDFAGMSAEAFVNDILIGRHNVAHVVSGYDFHFGKGRTGNPGLMKDLGLSLGFDVTVVEQVGDEDAHAPYSSSSVRQALRAGDVAGAARQLGYHWTLVGDVVEGDKRGRSIGFPTVNIRLEPGSEIREGIYAVRVRDIRRTPSQIWPGAGYVGFRPTFDTDRQFLEVYLLEFEGDLYQQRLAVEFVQYVRPDRRFDDVESLKRQMEADCSAIARQLEDVRAHDPVGDLYLASCQTSGRLWQIELEQF